MCDENRSTKIWKLAKSSLKDRCTKISQQADVRQESPEENWLA